MSIVSDIEIRLRADIARLQQDMNAARSTVGGAMNSITNAVDGAMKHMKQLAGAIAVGAFVGFIKETLDAVDALTDLSTRTGITVEDLAGLAYGAKLSGTELAAAAASISKLSVNMGKESDRFAKLGVTASEPLEAFKQLSDIFKSIQDPQQRAAFGAEALGKSWQEAAVLLNEGSAGITALVNRGQELSGITTQNSADAAQFNDALDELGAVAKGVSVRIAVDLLPVLRILTDDALNASKAANGVGDSFNILTETFKAVVVFGGNVLYVLKTVGEEIGGIAAQIVVASEAAGSLLRGDLKGAGAALKRAFGEGGIGDQMKADAEASRQAIDEWSARVINAGKETKEALLGVEFPDPFGIDTKITEETAARADAFLKYADLQAAAKKGADVAAAAAKKEQEAYRSLVTTLSERLATGKAESALGRELNDAEKAEIKLDSELASGKLKLTAGHEAQVRALMAEAAAQDKLAKSAKVVREAVQARVDQQNQSYANLAAETLANQQAVINYGLSKQAVEANTVALLEDQLARRSELEMSEDYAANLEREIALRKENAAALGALDAKDKNSDIAKAKELLDVMSAVDEAAQSAAQGMAASFGAVGSAIGGLTTALTGFGKAQATVAAELAASLKAAGKDPVKIQEAQTKAAKDGAAAQIKQYADMASAAKGFFKENSTGYKVLTTTEKAFRAYEMALAVESMLTKSGLLEAFTSLFVASKATETAVETGTTVKSVVNAGLQATAWAVTAVVKAIASLPFPMNLVAGAATLAAVVAVGAKVVGGLGSGGGASVSEQRQASNGTGTVLGDSSAKSESISKSLARIADNTYRGLSISSGMLSALRNIESGIGGLGGLLAQTSGVTNKVAGVTQGAAANFNAKTLSTFPLTAIVDKLTGGFLTKISNSVTNAIFGGKITALDTGITAGRTSLGQVGAGGLSVGQFTDIKKDGGLFSKDKYSSPVTALGREMDDQFTKIVLSLRDTIVSAAGALGVGGDSFTRHLNSFVVDLGKISFKGLNAADQQKALESAFSKMGDEMAKFGVAGLQSFQAVGEGYLETLVRIANDYATVDAVLASFGKTFGAVGIASVGAREELIKLAGGLDEFTSQGSFFLENFFTDAEKAATLRTAVNARLAPVTGGVELTTIEQYKALAMAQDLTTDSGRKTYATLMNTAEAFKQLVDYGNAAGRTLEDIASERKDIQKQIDALTMTSLQLRARERATLDAGNRVLYDQLQALNDLAAARTAETDKLTAVATSSKAFATSLNGVLSSLTQGSLSTLTPLQKLADAQGKYQQTLAAAKAGDATAQGELAASAQAFLTASQVVNASSARYAADAARVQAELAALAAAAVGKQTEAERQLTLLTAQADGILKVNESVNLATTSIVAAIDNLRATGYATPYSTVSMGNTPSTTPMGGPDNVALANALTAVQQELAAMRAEATQNAAHIADTVALSSASNANTITQGTKDAAMSQVYAEQLAPTVA